MPETVYKVDGLNNFVRTLRRAGADMNDLKDANAKAAATITSAAMTRVPRRSGKLASTIRGARQARRVVVSAGRATVPYAGPIHFGWPRHHIAANPYLTSAAVDTQAQWAPQYNADLAAIVGKVQGA